MQVSVATTVVALIVCGSAASAQDTAKDGPVFAATALQPTASFSFILPAGSLRLIGWDRDSLEIHGHMEPHSFAYGATGRGGKFIVESDNAGRAQPKQVVVYFPRHGTVRVETASADISVTDLAGTFISATGSIRVAGQSTSVDASAMSGNLDLEVSTPWLRARTGQGRLLLRGAPQHVDASTIGGALDIAAPTILRGRFSSVTGDIRYASTPAPTSLFEFSNHSGTIDLLLPDTVSARFDLSSITGPIENGFLQARPVSAGPHNLRISLGRGESQITVRSFKGTIRLRPR
jgi:hypothetical protein